MPHDVKDAMPQVSPRCNWAAQNQNNAFREVQSHALHSAQGLAQGRPFERTCLRPGTWHSRDPLNHPRSNDCFETSCFGQVELLVCTDQTKRNLDNPTKPLSLGAFDQTNGGSWSLCQQAKDWEVWTEFLWTPGDSLCEFLSG